MTDKKMCNDWPDAPGCEGEIDEAYTMRFDDIGQPPIYWCKPCGKKVQEIQIVIEQAFMERGLEFLEQLEEAIEDVQRQEKLKYN